LDKYLKFEIGTLSDVRGIESSVASSASQRRRVTPVTAIAPASGDAAFRAARWKSTKTNLRHAPRLFSSDHQPAQHPAMPARLPAPHLKPSSGSMEKRALNSAVKSPDLTVAIRATFSDHQDQQYPKTASLLARVPGSGNMVRALKIRIQT